MRRLAGVVAGAVLSAGAAFADEAVLVMPTALAARVDTSGAGVAVAIEEAPGGARVTLSQSVTALRAASRERVGPKGTCDDPRALDVPAGFAPPAELAGAQPAGAFAALERVVAFVTRRVRLDENDPGPQDGGSVLARGVGRCSGRANLAIGLLRAARVPARAVHGIVLGDEGPRWHRWGEAWLPGSGWVPFDPGASVGTVSVRYLPLRGAGDGSPLAGVHVERLDERAFLGVPVRTGVRVLPLRGVTVRCVAPAGHAAFTAALVGPDGTAWVRHGRGEIVFDGMIPGRYRIVWGGDGGRNVLNLVLGTSAEVLVDLGARREAGT